MFDWLIAFVGGSVGEERMVVTPQTPTPPMVFGKFGRVKPHIYRPLNGGWGCRSNSHWAFGATPKEAYDNWAVALYNSNAKSYQATAYPDGKSFIQWH